MLQIQVGKAIFRTSVFEGAVERKTPRDPTCVNSWENLDAMVEMTIRDMPGNCCLM